MQLMGLFRKRRGVNSRYTIPAATSTVGTLYFDGVGNPDALFIIRIKVLSQQKQLRKWFYSTGKSF
jgi:hypothetical protein